jgi:hypothetical protein
VNSQEEVTTNVFFHQALQACGEQSYTIPHLLESLKLQLSSDKDTLKFDINDGTQKRSVCEIFERVSAIK